MPRWPISPARTRRDTQRDRHRRDGGGVGKPRPAFVVQADPFDQTGTITVLLISGTLVNAPLIRLTVPPTPQDGLLKPSQIQIDRRCRSSGKGPALSSGAR
jgi:mRNA-degrading endonuclease toxin of MazEF toxin-antitoxin module